MDGGVRSVNGPGRWGDWLAIPKRRPQMELALPHQQRFAILALNEDAVRQIAKGIVGRS